MDRINILETKVEEERRAKNIALNEINDLEKRLYGPDKQVEENVEENISDDGFQRLIDTVNNSYKREIVEKPLLNISKRSSFAADNQIIDFLLKNALIEYYGSSSAGGSTRYRYKFTTFGDEFRRRYFMN